MVKLKIISTFVVFFSCCITIKVEAAREVENPLEDFESVGKASWNTNDNDDVLIMQMDLNGDSKNDIFMSHEHDINGRVGNIWVVYISQGDKFIRSDSIICLVPEDCIQKVSTKTGQTCLLTFRHPDRDTAILTGLTVSGTDVKENQIAKIELLGEYKLLSDSFFDFFYDDGNISRTAVKQGTLAELTKIYNNKNETKKSEESEEPNLINNNEIDTKRKSDENKQSSIVKPHSILLPIKSAFPEGTITVALVLFVMKWKSNKSE